MNQFKKLDKGLNLRPQTSAPVSPENGDVYYDSSLNLFRLRQNDTWISIGSGEIKADLYDPVSTSLPAGSSATIDGVSVVNGDQVLFSNLSVDNFRVYEVSGVGSSLVWTAVPIFSEGSETPTAGESVRFRSGDMYGSQLAIYDGSDFLVNDVIRLFDGPQGTDFWELSSIKTSTLADNTIDGIVFSVNVIGSENIIVNYSLSRDSGEKRTGQLIITSDGVTADITDTSAELTDAGVVFNTDINSGNIRLLFTTTSTGIDATMKYFLHRWSNSPGGPTGVPNYTGASSSLVTAAGATGDVQFKDPGGSLAANSKFNWDNSLEVLDLNGLEISPLSAGITLLNNQIAPTNIFTYLATYRFAIIEFSISRDGEFGVGRLLIANNGTITSLTEDGTSTNTLGVSLSSVVSGANVEVKYTTTDTGNNATFKYSIRRWG